MKLCRGYEVRYTWTESANDSLGGYSQRGGGDDGVRWTKLVTQTTTYHH